MVRRVWGRRATIPEVLARRFLCLVCKAVMTVVPAELLPWRRYSGAVIAMVLGLWSVCGWALEQLRASCSTMSQWVCGEPGWQSVRRWCQGHMNCENGPGVKQSEPLLPPLPPSIIRPGCNWRGRPREPPPFSPPFRPQCCRQDAAVHQGPLRNAKSPSFRAARGLNQASA